MNIDVLKTELTTDPLTRGYSSMTDEAAANDMNTINRTSNKAIMMGTEILNACDKVELNNLSTDNKRLVWDIIHIAGGVNPFGIEADLFVDAFGAGSTTITTLQTLRKNNISRGEELGIGIVREGHVQHARL